MAKEITKPASNRNRFVSVGLLFEPDVLAPHQYLKNHWRRNPLEPEKALLFAVLAEAVDTYQRYAFSRSSRGRTLFREAEVWFWSEEPDALFSFLSICDVFGLDAEFLRRGLMQWTASRRKSRTPRKKLQHHLERIRARKALNGNGNKWHWKERHLKAVGEELALG